MLIDAHIHFWKLARGDYAALTPDMPGLLRDHLPADLQPFLTARKIDHIVAVQAAETVAETRFMLDLARDWGVIAGVVGWVELSDPALPAILDEFQAHPVYKGVRPVRDDNRSMRWLADDALVPSLDLLATRGLSLDVLVQDPDEVPHVTAIAAAHPGLTVILDHCGKPDIAGGRFQPWANQIAALARHRNVACKLSGLLNCARPRAGKGDLWPYVNLLLDCFGPARMLWASDWPPLTLAADYDHWCDVTDALLAQLRPDERAAILGGTAARVYRL